MQISIDDAIAQPYLDAARAARIPVATLIARQLQRFSATPVTQRLLVITGEPLQALESTLGGGALKDDADLLARVHRWAGITIGDIRLNFSPAQLQEIELRARKQGRTPEYIVQDIVAQLQDQFFFGPTVAR